MLIFQSPTRAKSFVTNDVLLSIASSILKIENVAKKGRQKNPLARRGRTSRYDDSLLLVDSILATRWESPLGQQQMGLASCNHTDRDILL